MWILIFQKQLKNKMSAYKCAFSKNPVLLDKIVLRRTFLNECSIFLNKVGKEKFHRLLLKHEHFLAMEKLDVINHGGAAWLGARGWLNQTGVLNCFSIMHVACPLKLRKMCQELNIYLEIIEDE